MGAEFGANGWNLPLCANLILTANLAWCVKFAFAGKFSAVELGGRSLCGFLRVNLTIAKTNER